MPFICPEAVVPPYLSGGCRASSFVSRGRCVSPSWSLRSLSILRASSFAFGSSRSLAAHRSHSDHRDPSRLIVRIRIIAIPRGSRLIVRIRIIAIPRASSFAFGSSRSLAPHRSHSDHRDPSRLIVRIRIITIPRDSSFAFGSSQSFAPHHSHSDHRNLRGCGSIRRPLRRRQLLLRPLHRCGLVPPSTL